MKIKDHELPCSNIIWNAGSSLSLSRCSNDTTMKGKRQKTDYVSCTSAARAAHWRYIEEKVSRLHVSDTKWAKAAQDFRKLVLCYFTCPSQPPGTSSSAAKLAIASSAGWMSPAAVLKMSATKTKAALSMTTSWVCSCKYSSRGEEMASRSSQRRSSVFFLLMKETAH